MQQPATITEILSTGKFGTKVHLSCGHETRFEAAEVGQQVRCPYCAQSAFEANELERARAAAAKGGYTYVSGLGVVR